jgi:Uma2 family endonuclease
MPTLVNDPRVEEPLLAERRKSGLDKYDEVWGGVYVMAPLANNEHADIQTKLAAILTFLIGFPGLGRVHAGANVSDQPKDWTKNYRCPDVLVFLNGNKAEDRNTHWFGGPDFAVEVASPGDQSREKVDFYAGLGVPELLIIDRDPWQLELFRLAQGRLRSVAIATVENGLTVESQVVPISLGLAPGQKRPVIVITSRDGQSWAI